MAHLHASRICHRDLKLENILLATRERTALVKITDFGLSKHHSNESMKSFVGTKMYMAPEVIKARNRLERYTDKADMWSCGCILYSILCGTHAFTAEDNKLLEESKY